MFSVITENYKISVIVPCYNSANHILDCLQSFEKSKHTNLEIIIIDDLSTDNTIEVIKNFQKKTHLDIKTYFSDKKIGVGAARNIGMQLASGDYMTFQDSDDICHSYRMTFQLCSLLKNKQKKISLCLYYRYLNQKIIQINHKKYKKCIISMMFLRSETVSVLGGMSHIKIGSDSEFRERMLAYYGKDSQIIVPIPLYFAKFSQQSHFFSECKDIQYYNKKHHVIYDEGKITANHELMDYRVWHENIKEHKISPHISKKLQNFL